MGCTTLLARKWPQPVAPGSARRFEVSFDSELRRQWESRTWEVGDTIQVGAFDAECVQGGRSGQIRPDFSEVLGAEVPDGSVVWEIVEPSSSSLITSASFTWDPPSGITDSADADSQTSTTRLLTVGEDVVPGEYTVMVTATCGNSEIIKQPCILQVA